MTKTNARREGAFPHTSLDRMAILDELERILASPHFCNSKRYPALLRFIVDSTLGGKADLLKERTLGVEIFGRPADYDTNSDTIVRYTAGEVRKRLLLYYSEEGHNSGVRISLPAGSYVPEFASNPEKLEAAVAGEVPATHAGNGKVATNDGAPPSEGHAHSALSEGSESAPGVSEIPLEHGHAGTKIWLRPFAWIALAALLIGVVLAGSWWKNRTVYSKDAVNEFWAPVLRDQKTVLICTGGVVFSDDKYSGVTTAGKDAEYPFVSIQNASAIARVSGLLERLGVTTQLIPSSTTPLTELREHSVALLGGYNNQWTSRLLRPLRFHFSDDPEHTIVDALRPQFRLERDHSLPYYSADDYAVVARYRDTVTDGWAVVLAGLGRNGTEAAAQFATSPHYLELMRQQLGGFSNRNVEAVLKVNVIDGKTGAPSIVAVYSW